MLRIPNKKNHELTLTYRFYLCECIYFSRIICLFFRNKQNSGIVNFKKIKKEEKKESAEILPATCKN